MTNNEFISMIADYAIETYPASRVLPSVTIAQAILESGWGKSGLTTNANALFGIKAGSNWTGATYNSKTKEVIQGKTVNTSANFRAYGSWFDSVYDHGIFLASLPRYSNVIGNTDYKDVCKKLKDDGYATDPDYTNKLISLIETYALYKYDDAIKSPALMERVKNVEILVNPGDTVNLTIRVVSND